MASPAILIRAPDHLGDGVLALPAVRALARLGPVSVVGPAWTRTLYGPTEAPPPRPDVAVLFKPAFRSAWRFRRAGWRVGLATDARWPLLDAAVAPGGRHRLDDYAALARAAGAEPAGPPRWSPPAEEAEGAVPLPLDAVLLVPTTRSGPPVAWPGFRALADLLAERGWQPFFTGGPGEDEAVARIAGPHPLIPALPLGAFATLAARAAAVVANDSGLAHLAAAARRATGGDPERVHVVFGSTDPLRTGAPGATHHRPAEPPPCWPCYRKRCPLDLACQGVRPEAVAAAIG